MQLPRGTFHSIKKNVTFHIILEEAATTQFTGSILISIPNCMASLVLETGKIVLAAYQGKGGNEAVHRIEQIGEMQVNAEFTLLSESQLSLAKEFNKSCQIKLESGPTILVDKKELRRQAPSSDQKTLIKPVTLSPLGPRRTFSEGEVENLLDGDLDALDRMDLSKMSGKFRTNAESIARSLNLDHLVES